MDLSSWMWKAPLQHLKSLWEDPISAEHLDNQSEPWTLDPDGLLWNSGCMYIPDSRNLWLHVLQYSNNHPLAGHFSQTRHSTKSACITIGLDFLSMSKTTVNHVPLVPCQTLCHKPYGLLKQLQIPEKPWNSISMDFKQKLPPSSGYTSILVIVDHLSMQYVNRYDDHIACELCFERWSQWLGLRCNQKMGEASVWNPWIWIPRLLRNLKLLENP